MLVFLCVFVFFFFFANLSWKLKLAFLITFSLSSVSLSVRPSVCPWIFPIFNIFPRTTGPIQPHLAQSTIRQRSLRFWKVMTTHREIIMNYWKRLSIVAPVSDVTYWPLGFLGLFDFDRNDLLLFFRFIIIRNFRDYVKKAYCFSFVL